LFNSQQINFLT